MQPKMMNVAGIVFIAAVGLFVLMAATYDRLRKRQVSRLLASREQLDVGTFAATYFGHSPDTAEVAARLRHVLSANLKQRLDGLRPDDRLDEDLHAELLANPDLFWDIEREFGVTAPTNDWAAYEQCVA